MQWGNGLFKDFEKVNNNAYKLELPSDISVSSTLNVGNVMRYLADNDDLRENFNQKRTIKIESFPILTQIGT